MGNRVAVTGDVPICGFVDRPNLVHAVFDGSILQRRMLRRAEEDGDRHVDILMNVDEGKGWGKGTITPFVDENIVSEEHILMDATPFYCRRMILH